MTTKSDNVYLDKSLYESIKAGGVEIYRYISFYRLLEMITRNRMFFPQVKIWEDVYEIFLAKTRINKEGVNVSYIDCVDAFYGQCWTTQRESDAHWRIYSADKNGVRIKCNLNNLADAIMIEENHIKCSTVLKKIGIVQYKGVEDIEKWVSGMDKYEINLDTITDSLFIKRMEFSHEKEVRIIVRKVLYEWETHKSLLSYIIKPNSLIEEVTFDPRIEDSQFEVNKEILRSIGFSNSINKSELYTFNITDIK